MSHPMPRQSMSQVIVDCIWLNYITSITENCLKIIRQNHNNLNGKCFIWQWQVHKYHCPVFTARCTLVQSAVLPSHVVCLSVRLCVTLVDCDHIGWNSSKIISPLVNLGCSLFATPTWRVCSKGTPLNLGPKWPTPLIWASETFDRKLRPNGHR